LKTHQQHSIHPIVAIAIIGLSIFARSLAAEPPAPWLEKQDLFEARPGRGGDYDFNDVLMRRSTDGGKTFGPIVAVFHDEYARAFTLHSDDDGATWSEPTEITEVFHAFKPDYPWVVCAKLERRYDPLPV
jgi:Neuraminidase (sialidase)